jgi:hypothetical protein
MTTLSHQVPSLEDRTLASTLIVIGTVEEGPVCMPDYSTDPPQVHSHFRVSVEEILRGRAAGDSVVVRVLGGQVDELRTEWTSTMRERDRVLLFLAPYYAVDREEDTFVPYFRSCFTVSADGVVAVGGPWVKEAGVPEQRDTMTLEGVRSFVQATLERHEQANAQQPEREPEEPEVAAASLNAMLYVEPGGARWATLDGGEEARRSGG